MYCRYAKTAKETWQCVVQVTVNCYLKTWSYWNLWLKCPLVTTDTYYSAILSCYRETEYLHAYSSWWGNQFSLHCVWLFFFLHVLHLCIYVIFCCCIEGAFSENSHRLCYPTWSVRNRCNDSLDFVLSPLRLCLT